MVCPGARWRRHPAADRSRDDRHHPRRHAIERGPRRSPPWISRAVAAATFRAWLGVYA